VERINLPPRVRLFHTKKHPQIETIQNENNEERLVIVRRIARVCKYLVGVPFSDEDVIVVGMLFMLRIQQQQLRLAPLRLAV
jgi:hypothetical protein